MRTLASAAADAGSSASRSPVATERAGSPTVVASMLALAFGPSAILLVCFGVFLPALRAEFGWSIASISFGASIISATIMVASPLQGYLADRFGPRRLVLVFMPFWGVGLILMRFLPDDITIFYLACLLLPIAGLGLWPLVYMKAVTTWFDRHLGLALGTTNVGLGIGAVVLPPLLAIAFVQIGWRNAYVVLGLSVLLVVWPVAAIWFKQGPRANSVRATVASRDTDVAVGDAIRTREFWIMIICFVILGIISTGMLVHQVAILLDAGVPQDRAIVIQSAVGLGSIVGRIGTGWLLDRIKVQFVGAGMFLIAGAACMLLASDAAAAIAVPVAATIGLVIGAEFDILGVLIRRYQGISAFGRIYGIVFSAFQLGGAAGAAGLAICRTNLGSYGPALVSVALASLFGAALFLMLGRYRFMPEARSAVDGDMIPRAPAQG